MQRSAGKMFISGLLVGFGLFNVLEGIIDHHVLKLDHVSETVPPEQWIYWDIGFLVLGATMFVIGWRLLKSGESRFLRTASLEKA